MDDIYTFHDKKSIYQKFIFLKNANLKKMNNIMLKSILLKDTEKLNQHWYFTLNDEQMNFFYDLMDHWIKITFNSTNINIQLNELEMMKLCNGSKSIAIMLGCIRDYAQLINDMFEPSEILKMYHIFSEINQYFSSNDDDESLAHLSKWKKKLKEITCNYSMRAMKLLLFILPRFCLCHKKSNDSSLNQKIQIEQFEKMRIHEYNLFNDHWDMYNGSKTYTRLLNNAQKHFAYYDYIKNIDAIYIIGLEYGIRYTPVLDDRCQCLLEWFIIHKYMNIEKKTHKIPFFYYGITDNRWRQCVLKTAKVGSYDWIDAELKKNKYGINDINEKSNRYCIASSRSYLLNDIKSDKMERIINGIFTTIDHDYQ
jgi:hypothetical protein